METLERAKFEYKKRMAKLNNLLNRLNNNEIKELERRGLITINRDKIPNETDIIYESFHTAITQYCVDHIFVYVCDLVDNGYSWGTRQYTKFKIRDIEKNPTLEKPYNICKYIGLLTGSHAYTNKLLGRYDSIIQLPYDYQIAKSTGLYYIGTWPLWSEGYNVEGFAEQFNALQDYYYKKLLESSWKEAEEAVKDKQLLKEICLKK